MSVGMLLTASASMTCPHGGTVIAVPSSPKVTAGGDPILSASDSFIVAGCPFTLGVPPHPCVTVQWATPNANSRAGGAQTLSTDSVGLCMAADQAAQGIVIIQSTQPRVHGR